ncbi:MAG: recombinase zinc beta ribbon domain-containing protein [Solirubrobacteraceae bacterium]
MQALLAARSVAGDRPSKHEHYLRGSLYCADCGGRLLYTKQRGNGGLYEYFSCINRQSRKIGGRCHSAHYPADLIERAVEQHYRTIRLTKRVQETIWADVRRDAGERTAIVAKDIERHRRRIKKLEDNQARLVQLSYRGLVSDEVLASEQQRLETEKAQAQRLLDAAKLQASDVEAALDGALAKTRTPHATYIASTPLERRLLNQTFFKRILIGEDHQVAGTTLTPVYAALASWHEPLGQPRPESTLAPRNGDTAPKNQGHETANPGPLLRGQGLHMMPMVELGGLEPPTSWVRFAPWRQQRTAIYGSSTGETPYRTAWRDGRNSPRFVPISGGLGTKTGLCPMARRAQSRDGPCRWCRSGPRVCRQTYACTGSALVMQRRSRITAARSWRRCSMNSGRSCNQLPI